MTRTIKASLLFSVFALCAAAIVVTQRARQQVPPPAPHQLFAVVEQHLSAFRAADYSSIYRQASSGVQQKFTPPQYEAMIRRDYAEVARAERIECSEVFRVTCARRLIDPIGCRAHLVAADLRARRRKERRQRGIAYH